MDMAENTGTSSAAFMMLDERIRRWIWRNEWTAFRDVQEQAIPVLLENKSDVVLAAPTSAGKTEAAFLPILTNMLKNPHGIGLTVYISPLTALINDQFFRLTQLCLDLEIPIHPWHGGISASVKKHFFDENYGILLITPEALQAFFCNHGFEIPKLFKETNVIVVDELHSFISSERGKQLQTLLHLLELRTKKIITRVGLSATLGDMELAASFLRPQHIKGRDCVVLVSNDNKTKIKLLLKGITENKTVDSESQETEPEETFSAPHAIAGYLWNKLRGSNNLVFPNSRSNVEFYTHLLSVIAESSGIPNEFYAHHGNLSKEIREEAENALKSTEHCATVICTSTLELGIDIGNVASVVQIGPPPSVASLRQRVGRSGRRQNEASVLRAFTVEEALSERAHIFSRLRENTFQMCASIMLLLDNWCEPPSTDGLHLSTLVQQVMSVIAERGGAVPEKLFDELCGEGPFSAVAEEDFEALIRALIKQEMLEKDDSGLLLLGEKGERRLKHFSFYAAFSSETEYRIVTAEKTLGTIPVSSSLQRNDLLIFAGKSWRVKNIDDKSRVVEVTFFGKGRPPVFTGSGFCLHTFVRTRMRSLYETEENIPFADTNVRDFIDQGRDAYKQFDLQNSKNIILESGGETALFTWFGDKANRTLQLLLRSYGVSSYTGGIGLTINGQNGKELRSLLRYIKTKPFPAPNKLLGNSQNLVVEKWDYLLPRKLLIKNYCSLYLAQEETKQWLAALPL